MLYSCLANIRASPGRIASAKSHVNEGLFHFTSHGLYTNHIHVQRFFGFSQHTPVVHTKISLYTLVAHTHKDFFSHIIYTRKNPSIHIFLLHTYMRNIFLFLYIRRHFIHNASFFLSWFWFILFLFWTMFLKMKNSTRFRNFNKHYWQQWSKY